MKQFLLLICSMSGILSGVAARTGDTLHVVSHHQETVVTNPATGGNAYKRWVVFPDTKTGIRKINLNVLFGCPDSMRCADWDYLDRIYIRRKGGVNSPSMDYEIGHMLTPYGGAFSKTWHFQWQVDVTDFSMLLRDSVEIEYFHSGYEANKDRGWKVTLDFEMITGKPVLEPIAIHKVYDGSFAYGDSTKDIETMLKPVSFTANAKSKQARIFIYQTGHGSDANGCGEFCSRYREVWFDEKMIDKRDIWKKCGDNPLYPQAGTWIIDRANWCPGDLQQPDIFDLPISGGTQHTININMEPYKTKNPSANEVICAYVIEYSKPAAVNDVAIEDIIVPTDEPIYLRKNPSAVHPVILVRNNGSHSVHTLAIEYGTKGFGMHQYNWSGNIAFNQKAMIVLPAEVQSKEGLNIFTASVSSPNGKKDGTMSDNTMSASFTKVPVHGGTLVLNLRTNDQPEQNAYTLRNSAGIIMYERKMGALKANHDYRDTFRLVPGNYEFELIDTAGDGLEFWFNNKGGRGVCRLLNDKGQLIRHFESDFGNTIRYGFEISNDSTAFTQPASEPAIGLYPTRTTGKTSLDYFANAYQKVVVKIVTDPGDTVIEEHVYNSLKEATLQFDLSYRPAQRYYVKVFIGNRLVFNKRLRVEEMRNR